MEIIEVSIEKLKPNKNSLRIGLRESDSIFKCLIASVVKFGLQFPLLINEDYGVISGNQLLKILKFLSYEKVPCIVTNISSEKELDLSIALNKIDGDWFVSGLREYFKKHKHSKKELEALGFESLEIDSLMALDEFPDLAEKSENDTQLKIF